MADNKSGLPLTLKIVTPTGAYDDIFCDSINITLKDGENNKGGGSYGIHRGHTASVFATDKGKITASVSGKEIFSEEFGEGFASFRENKLTVMTVR